MTLTLCDTHDNEKDIYVHHVLVSENFAKHHEITEITSDLKSEQSSKDGHVSALVNGVQNLAVASPQHRFVKRFVQCVELAVTTCDCCVVIEYN